jgi:murein L,D-transpeptidase YafK
VTRYVNLIAIAIVGAGLIACLMPLLDRPQTPLSHGVEADLIVVEKSTHHLNLFKDGQLLRSYRVAIGSGGQEPKAREGDARTPEGTYFIDRRNLHSCCHLALHISYPNAADTAAARAHGVSAGNDIEIHGLPNGLGWLGRWHRIVDWTNGCMAVTDSEMDEIWRVVPDRTRIVIRH